MTSSSKSGGFFVVWCLVLLTSSVSAGKNKVPKVATADDYQQFLHDLSGHWVGTGFTVIAIPSKKPTGSFDLKTFHTHESFVASGVREGIRNAGATFEIFLNSLQYHQQVSDITTHKELHVEAGMWLYQPPTPDDTTKTNLLWRSGTVPHGCTFLAGTDEPMTISKNPPDFDEEVISTPFLLHQEDNRINGSYIGPYEADPLPESMNERYGAVAENIVISPFAFLERDNEDVTICETRTVSISSVAPGLSIGGVVNIPMLQSNANASQVEVTVYIEKVKDDDGSFFYQLQYVQEVYINFPIEGFGMITWPHISVATLRKQAGEYV